MLIDAHLHCTGKETTQGVLRTLDEAQVDVGVLLAPFLSPGYDLNDPASLRRGNEHLAKLVRGHEDRLVGFCVVDPRQPDAPADLRHAIEDLGLKGVKMVPAGWYPHEERVQATFEVAHQLKLPALFHSGVFIDGRSSRFCRPSYFEALRAHPGMRITLAHLGWPWTDEAIAVGLIDLIHGVPADQVAFRFDLSFGAPPVYRKEVLGRALSVLGSSILQFGSDCFLPCSGRDLLERRGWLEDLLTDMEIGQPERDRIFHKTASSWLGLANGAGSDSLQDARAESLVHRSLTPDSGAEPDSPAFFRSGWRPVCC